MSQLSSPAMSPGGLFARIESLKKWQLEQQQRLMQQQVEQEEFLANEHKRMFDALSLGASKSCSSQRIVAEHGSSRRTINQSVNNYDSELGVSVLEISDDEHQNTSKQQILIQTDVDEIPIKSPKRDFKALLEEKLKNENDEVVLSDNKNKPKRPFLKRGAGLSKYRMTINDLPYKHKQISPQVSNKRKNENNAIKVGNVPKNFPSKERIPQNTESKVREKDDKPKVVTFESPDLDRTEVDKLKINKKHNEPFKMQKPILKKCPVSNFDDQALSRASWENIFEKEKGKTENENDYKALLEELIEMRQNNPQFFEQPSEISEAQMHFEQELMDELKLFELLEQKAANSSFSSTSSIVTKLMEHAVKGSPPRQNLNIMYSPILKSPIIRNAENSLKTTQIDNMDNTEKSFMSRLIQSSIKSTPKQCAERKTPQLNFEETPVCVPDEKLKFQKNILQQENFKCNTNKIPDSENQMTEEDSDNSSITSEDLSKLDSNKTITDEQTWSDCSQEHKTPASVEHNNESTFVTVVDVATNTDEQREYPLIPSDILKTRLEELEKEIATFRTENSRVSKLKSELETESRNLNRRKKQLEKNFEEKQEELNAHIAEEKRKVARERAVYDRYTREMRNKTTKKEKEEITVLQNQVANLKEELKLKESRWGATHARLRTQIKQLEKENVSLKADNEELRKKNGKLEAIQKQLTSKKPSDTKMLHEINKNLTKLAKEAHLVVPKTAEITRTSKYKQKHDIKKSDNKKRPSLTVPTSSEDEKDNADWEEESSDSDPIVKLLETSKNKRKDKENNRNSLNSTGNDSMKSKSSDRSFDSIERDYEKVFGKIMSKEALPAANASGIDESYKKSREEKILEDGSKQIIYSNNNIKTISPDGDLVVMKYYNGDVKETCYSAGTVKYLYAEANTWHTTCPDGHEVLEFPNGQVEKRFKDGSSEIFFPNGCQRCVSPGGTEEIRFPDGTVLINNGSGQKILNLPNGQKEIHTADHKRREYPDGTVKLLYPDGIQETRYANGRIRLKDKNGHLIMDSGSI